MNILEIYKKYRIQPFLQLHQLRVASVAKLIADNMTVPVDTDAIVQTGLLHDMGNILKFDLDIFPEAREPEGKEYWQQVKDDFRRIYQTDDAHVATLAIAREIGVSDKVQKYIDSIAFAKAGENDAQPDISQKICDYADCRVAPYGVLSIEERVEEGKPRYLHRRPSDDKTYGIFLHHLHNIEDTIFANCKIKPTDINDESIAPIVEQLKAYEI